MILAFDITADSTSYVDLATSLPLLLSPPEPVFPLQGRITPSRSRYNFSLRLFRTALSTLISYQPQLKSVLKWCYQPLAKGHWFRERGGGGGGG
jgi:hypothetical protein